MSASVITMLKGMARWEPDARGRLEQAALELYGERGFEATTVAEIARRAGLTERTFFRHFADKREVLFAGSEALEEALVRAVADAPAEAGLRGGGHCVDARAVADGGLVTAGPQSPVQFASVTLGALGLLSEEKRAAYDAVFADGDDTAYTALMRAAA